MTIDAHHSHTKRSDVYEHTKVRILSNTCNEERQLNAPSGFWPSKIGLSVCGDVSQIS